MDSAGYTPGSPGHADAVEASHAALQRKIDEAQRRLDAKEKEVQDQHHAATMQIIQHSKSHRELTAAESERAQANWDHALDLSHLAASPSGGVGRENGNKKNTRRSRRRSSRSSSSSSSSSSSKRAKQLWGGVRKSITGEKKQQAKAPAAEKSHHHHAHHHAHHHDKLDQKQPQSKSLSFITTARHVEPNFDPKEDDQGCECNACKHLDKWEGMVAERLFPCPSCRENGLGGELRRTILFCFTLLLLFIFFGGIIQALEAPGEIAYNLHFTTLMQRIAQNVSSEDFQELASFLPADPVEGSTVWVAFAKPGADQTTGSWALSSGKLGNAVFFMFTLASTIGYGDFTPQTPGGRFLGFIAGMVLIPLAIFTYKKMSNLVFYALMHTFLRKSGEIKQAFQVFDTDHSGFISTAELKDALHTVGLTHIGDKEICVIMAMFDKNSDNQLSLGEFTQIAIHFDVDVAGVTIESFKAKATAVILLCWVLIFCSWFATLHQVSFLDSIWFCFSTFTTTGFGDIVPIKNARFMCMFLSFFGLGFMAMAIDAAVTTIRRNMERRKHEIEAAANLKVENSIRRKTKLPAV